MKNIYLLAFVCFVLVGCTSSQVQPPASPNNKIEVVVTNIPPPPQEKGIGCKAGEIGESGIKTAGNWIWNAGKGVWEWASSAEVQQKVKSGVAYIWDWGKGVVVRVGKAVSE